MKTKLFHTAWRMLAMTSIPEHCGGTPVEATGSSHLRRGRRAWSPSRNVTEEKLDLSQEYGVTSSRRKMELMLLQAERQA